MEQRQDYVENEISLLSRMLKRLLEKLMKIKSAGTDVLLEQIAVFHTDEKVKEVTVKDLQAIDNSLLISTLTDIYGYKAGDVQLLADILYELIQKDAESNQWMRPKALILYKHFLATIKDNIHLYVFLRIQELKQQ